MNHSVQAEDDAVGLERLNKLIQVKDQLTLTIELVWQSVKSLELSALSAELSSRGHISPEREAWIRATVRSKDQAFLDSLYIDLEIVKKKIASLTPHNSGCGRDGNGNHNSERIQSD